MKEKSEVGEHFINFVAFVKTATGKTVQILRTNGGKEYCSQRMDNFFASSGIVHQTSNPYTPQQNGVSERMNRTAMKSTQSSMYMKSNRFTNMFEKASNSILELWESS